MTHPQYLQPVEEKKPKYVVRPPNTLKSAFLENLEARQASEAAESAAKVSGNIRKYGSEYI